jgi:hypothetical protein
MKPKYFHYFEYNNWLAHREKLIDYKSKKIPIDHAWYGVNQKDFDLDLEDIVKDLKEVGLIVKQIIFISFPTTDLNSKDLNDTKTIYIHVDSKDDEEHLLKDIAPTAFAPRYVLNIPLINCEQSKTFFYEFIDSDKNTSYQHAWGGGCVDYSNVTEVDSLTLDKPAFLKVDVPHAVHNPTDQLRIVCSMRIDDNSPALIKLLGQ